MLVRRRQRERQHVAVERFELGLGGELRRHRRERQSRHERRPCGRIRGQRRAWRGGPTRGIGAGAGLGIAHRGGRASGVTRRRPPPVAAPASRPRAIGRTGAVSRRRPTPRCPGPARTRGGATASSRSRSPRPAQAGGPRGPARRSGRRAAPFREQCGRRAPRRAPHPPSCRRRPARPAPRAHRWNSEARSSSADANEMLRAAIASTSASSAGPSSATSASTIRYTYSVSTAPSIVRTTSSRTLPPP